VNIALPHYKHHLINVVREIIAVYSKKPVKDMDTFSGQNAELQIIESR
jgi:hypothetical protein